MDLKPKVIVTGFGPFSHHVINDSASCARKIKDSGLEEELNIEIITEILHVVYDRAIEKVLELWCFHDPFLVVHLGVHNRKDCITIEKCARKQGYDSLDIAKKCPVQGICPFGEQEHIYTEVDVDSIVRKCLPCHYDLNSSEDAGLYLCEYVYYASLSYDRTRVIFVHVPPFSGIDSLQTKVDAVKDIIKFTFLHLCEKEGSNNIENSYSQN